MQNINDVRGRWCVHSMWPSPTCCGRGPAGICYSLVLSGDDLLRQGILRRLQGSGSHSWSSSCRSCSALAVSGIASCAFLFLALASALSFLQYVFTEVPPALLTAWLRPPLWPPAVPCEPNAPVRGDQDFSRVGVRTGSSVAYGLQ